MSYYKDRSTNIETKYLEGYKEAARKCWYVEEYLRISHIEMREARNQGRNVRE